MEYYTAIKREEVLTYTTQCVNLENITLNKKVYKNTSVASKKKRKHYTQSKNHVTNDHILYNSIHMICLEEAKIHRDRKWSRSRGKQEVIANVYGFF